MPTDYHHEYQKSSEHYIKRLSIDEIDKRRREKREERKNAIEKNAELYESFSYNIKKLAGKYNAGTTYFRTAATKSISIRINKEFYRNELIFETNSDLPISVYFIEEGGIFVNLDFQISIGHLRYIQSILGEKELKIPKIKGRGMHLSLYKATFEEKSLKKVEDLFEEHLKFYKNIDHND